MIVVRLSEQQLLEFGQEHDTGARVWGTSPLSAAAGTKSTAVVYFEIAPGKRLPTHTDSAEEVLYILEGTAEVVVGDERSTASAGDLALVPSMVPHSARNIGDTTVRVLGFFSSSTNMATFDYPMVPINPAAAMGSPYGERTFLIPPPVALEQSAAPMAEAHSV